MQDAMTRPMRILGFCALLALGLHGFAALGHHHDSGVEQDCVVCHFQPVKALAADAHHSEAPPEVVDQIADKAPTVAILASLALHSPRGPPA